MIYICMSKTVSFPPTFLSLRNTWPKVLLTLAAYSPHWPPTVDVQTTHSYPYFPFGYYCNLIVILHHCTKRNLRQWSRGGAGKEALPGGRKETAVGARSGLSYFIVQSPAPWFSRIHQQHRYCLSCVTSWLFEIYLWSVRAPQGTHFCILG